MIEGWLPVRVARDFRVHRAFCHRTHCLREHTNAKAEVAGYRRAPPYLPSLRLPAHLPYLRRLLAALRGQKAHRSTRLPFTRSIGLYNCYRTCCIRRAVARLSQNGKIATSLLLPPAMPSSIGGESGIHGALHYAEVVKQRWRRTAC